MFPGNAPLAKEYAVLAHRIDTHPELIRTQKHRIANAQVDIADHFERNGDLAGMRVKMLANEAKAILEYRLQRADVPLDRIEKRALWEYVSARANDYRRKN